MAHPNETLIRNAFAAFSRGDLDWFRNEGFSEDIVHHIPGKSPIAGDKEGIDAELNFFMQLARETNGTFRVELVDVMAKHDRAVALQHGTATRGDKTFDGDELMLFEIEDGKITEIWSHPRDLYAVDDFWS